MNLFIIILIIGILFLLFKKVVNQFESKILKINPYVQILISLFVLFIISFILMYFAIDAVIFGKIVIVLSLISTIYLGVVFQHYYFMLSDKFNKEEKC